jgi:hypothetical protein
MMLFADHLNTSENGGIPNTEFAKLIFRITMTGIKKNKMSHDSGNSAKKNFTFFTLLYRALFLTASKAR